MPARRPDPAGVVRILEASGASRRSFEAAVAAALRSASKEISRPVGVEVARLWADVDGGAIGTYRAAVKIAYRQTLVRPKRSAG